MKLKKIMLFGNDRRQQYFTVNADDGLPRFFEDSGGKIYERFNALNTADTVRYCEVSVRRLTDLVVEGAIADVT